jgi:hypothetical protein
LHALHLNIYIFFLLASFFKKQKLQYQYSTGTGYEYGSPHMQGIRFWKAMIESVAALAASPGVPDLIAAGGCLAAKR